MKAEFQIEATPWRVSIIIIIVISFGGQYCHFCWWGHPRDNCAQKYDYLEWNKCRKQGLDILYYFKQRHSSLTSVHLLTLSVCVDAFCCPGSWDHPWLKPFPNTWLPKARKALLPAGLLSKVSSGCNPLAGSFYKEQHSPLSSQARTTSPKPLASRTIFI